MYIYRSSSKPTLLSFLGIKDLPNVVTATKLYLLSPFVVDTPDPSSYWKLQQHCKYEGEGTTIAIVDTEIYKHHPSIALKSLCEFVGDHSLSMIDTDGHGTLCAGVACGDPFQRTVDSSIVKCRGVAPKTTLVVCKAYERRESTWYGVHVLQKLITEIDTKSLKQLDVAVLSAAPADNIPGLHEAIKVLVQRDVIVVCAASNEGAIDKAAIHYPAHYPETICI